MASDTKLAMDAECLGLLCCPVTLQRLSAAPDELIARLELLRAAGTLKDSRGQSFAEPVTAALLRDDGLGLYPIRDGLPMLLPEELIILPVS